MGVNPQPPIFGVVLFTGHGGVLGLSASQAKMGGRGFSAASKKWMRVLFFALVVAMTCRSCIHTQRVCCKGNAISVRASIIEYDLLLPLYR